MHIRYESEQDQSIKHKNIAKIIINQKDIQAFNIKSFNVGKYNHINAPSSMDNIISIELYPKKRIASPCYPKFVNMSKIEE